MTKVRYAKSEKIVTPVARVRACNIEISSEDQFGSVKNENHAGKQMNTFQLEFLLPKADKECQAFYKKLKKIEADLLLETFGKKVNPTYFVIKDGDETDKEDFSGFFVLRAKRKAVVGDALPIVLNDRKGELTKPETFYSGCWARAQVQLKAYQVSGSKGVSCSLLTAQFVRDDDPIFQGKTTGDTMDAIEEYDSESDNLLGEAA
jgi:hypothetical protein